MWIGGIGPGVTDKLYTKFLFPVSYRCTSECGQYQAISGFTEDDSLLYSCDVSSIGYANPKIWIGDDNNAGCSIELNLFKCSLTVKSDRFGLHRVYYTKHGENWLFSNSLLDLKNTISTANKNNLRLNYTALHGYLAFSYVPMPETLYSDIKVLPAGATLVAKPEGDGLSISVTIFDAPRWGDGSVFGGTQDEAAWELKQLLQKSVLTRIDPKESVGVFLSGGLDSCLVAALLVEADIEVKLFTLDFGPLNSGSDLQNAMLAATHLGCKLEVVPASPLSIKSALQRRVAAYEMPFGDGVTAPLILLCNAAANRNIETVFNGEGGDQIFGGWANKPMIAAELYGTEGYSREVAYMDSFHRFLKLTDELYTIDFLDRIEDVDAAEWVRPALTGGGYKSLLQQLRAANLNLKGAQNIAPRCLMAARDFGIKVQAPFFDSDLADWSFTLPDSWLLSGTCEKYLLKQVAAQYLPEEVVWQEKRGMGVPLTEWCMGELKSLVASKLNRAKLQRQGIFNADYVQSLLKGESQSAEFRTRRVGEKIWTLFMYQLWSEEHLQQ